MPIDPSTPARHHCSSKTSPAPIGFSNAMKNASKTSNGNSPPTPTTGPTSTINSTPPPAATRPLPSAPSSAISRKWRARLPPPTPRSPRPPARFRQTRHNRIQATREADEAALKQIRVEQIVEVEIEDETASRPAYPSNEEVSESCRETSRASAIHRALDDVSRRLCPSRIRLGPTGSD